MAFPTSIEASFLFFFAFGAANTLGSVAFFSLVERRLAASRKLLDLPLEPGQVRRERLGTAIFTVAFAGFFAALVSAGWVRTQSFGPGAAALTFLGCMLSWDLFYYGLHRLLHTKRFAHIHAWHHASIVNTPWAALSLSPLETLGWLAGLALWPVLASPFLPVVPEALLAWLVVFWWTNTMGHVNVELAPASASATRIGQWVTHPILYHALHHARYRHHYCFFLNSLDELFGSVWRDYPTLHQRVCNGRPLRRRSERGEDWVAT